MYPKRLAGPPHPSPMDNLPLYQSTDKICLKMPKNFLTLVPLADPLTPLQLTGLSTSVTFAPLLQLKMKELIQKWIKYKINLPIRLLLNICIIGLWSMQRKFQLRILILIELCKSFLLGREEMESLDRPSENYWLDLTLWHYFTLNIIFKINFFLQICINIKLKFFKYKLIISQKCQM